MECGICKGKKLQFVLSKPDKWGKVYSLYRCKDCGTVQIQPIPTLEELKKYYTQEYFTRRTDRGYNNYYSESIQKELYRVWNLNLRDLGILENVQKNPGRCLDVGCAAGYFVKFMQEYGWDAVGLDIAEDPVQYGKTVLGLQLYQEDFLEWDKEAKEKFDLITLWASIEHLPDPLAVLQKVYQHLKEGGIFAMSTCRYGLLAKWKGENWRFLNVPEHLFYFGKENFTQIMKGIGFRYYGSVFYGSGLTAKPNANWFYKTKKKILDSLVKWTGQGDMMAFSFLR